MHSVSTSCSFTGRSTIPCRRSLTVAALPIVPIVPVLPVPRRAALPRAATVRERPLSPSTAIMLFGAILLLCGCFKTKDELTLEADGSGKVRIETRTSIPVEMLSGAGLGLQMGASEIAIYPPITESEAKKFFPGNAFAVTAREEKTGDSGRIVVIEAAFKDVNTLLASPYGRAHALTLKLESGKLLLKALSCVEAA